MATIREITPRKEKVKSEVRVAAYCRVSTHHEEQASSLALQIQAYQRFAACHPEWINVGIYSEIATGRNTRRRPEYQKLLQECRDHKIDVIYTKSISRFGRDVLELLKTFRELKQLGVDIFFDREFVWLHQDEAKLMITIYCAFAQSESRSISQNIQWGIEHSFADGTSGFAHFSCYGYKKDKENHLMIDRSKANIVRTIFEMRADGKSLGAISNWLWEQEIPSPDGKDRWSRETLRKLLLNEKYTGNVLLQKTVVENFFSGTQVKNTGQKGQYLILNNHPAIISQELFAKVNPGIIM